MEDWLNSEDVLSKADVMIYQGSSLSFYQAIIHRVPTIVVPKHPGHEIIARYVSKSGIGEVLDYYHLKENAVIKTLERILADDFIFNCAQQRIKEDHAGIWC